MRAFVMYNSSSPLWFNPEMVKTAPLMMKEANGGPQKEAKSQVKTAIGFGLVALDAGVR